MRVKVYTLNAFAKEDTGGNPAGVVLNADFLSDDDMQKVAAKVGFSETAFVRKTDDADFKVNFFTPSGEVDLCGHATIATFCLLKDKGIIHAGEYTQETRAGILNVECRDDDEVYMDQCSPKFYNKLDKKYIADTLNIHESEIMDDIPVQIVSTGLNDILVPIRSLDALYKVRPDFDKISRICKEEGTIGYHIFTLETKHNSTAHCRNFAPLYGIDEESATGTSTGALGCYLYKYGVVSEDDAAHLTFEQGYCMKRPSEISVRLTIRNKGIACVKVGGRALNIAGREIEI